MAAYTVVEYLADHDGYKCGYCGSKDSNFSHGMWAHSMTCEDYQDLIDRGWRRSGKYCYKPTMNKMCCPSYTIRCDAPRFKTSKSQKKVLKKVARYLVNDEKPKGGGGEEDKGGCSDTQESERHFANANITSVESSTIDTSSVNKETAATVQTQEKASQGEKHDEMAQGGSSGTQENTEESTPRRQPKPGLGRDPNKPQCKKAKQLRMERKQQRLAQRQASTDAAHAKDPGIAGGHDGKSQAVTNKRTVNNAPKSLEDLLIDAIPGQESKHKLEVRLVRSSPRSPEFQETFQTEYEIYKKYQVTIHKDPPTKCNERQIKLVRNSPRSEEFESTVVESHAIFAKYQMAIHKDPPEECTMRDFTRFLVDSPLQPEHSHDGPECGYGTFHQQYWLDNKLIAVGVMDILPRCVSSVYLFYDPDYGFLNLGTYSALREVAFVRLLHAVAPSIEYYYMGFYIHSCVKMKYKGNYTPSYIVCPEAFTWQPYEKCVPKLDTSKYSRLDETEATDPERLESLDRVLVLHRQAAISFGQYKRLKPDAPTDAVKEYAGIVGKTCAERMLLYRE